VSLLFDQNISFRIISKIKSNFPEAKQIRQLGIENYSDIEIWKYAKENKFTIVTFDADFFDLSNFKGHPPKIIWLRFGNTRTDFLADLINSKNILIKDFINSEEYSQIACLEVTN
jgi:predicted nuclease of predicted toxin-antitoxin system